MTASPPPRTARSPAAGTRGSPASCRPHLATRRRVAPTLNAPANAATGVSTSPTLNVGVSDPDADALTVTYFGRPFASGNYVQIAQHSGVASGTSDTASWSNLGAGQTFQWRVTVSDGSLTTTGPTWTFHTVPSADPVFVGAGDIADCTRTQDEATAAVIGAVDGTVWTAGDNVYPTGMATYFTNCYEPSWGGAIKARTRPVPGNHDWGTDSGPENLDGYFGYYGANATDAAARATTATTSRTATGTSSTSTASASSCPVACPWLWLYRRISPGASGWRPISPPTVART